MLIGGIPLSSLSLSWSPITGADQYSPPLTLKSLLLHSSGYSTFPNSPSLCTLPPFQKRRYDRQRGGNQPPKWPGKLLLHYSQWPIFACSESAKDTQRYFNCLYTTLMAENLNAGWHKGTFEILWDTYGQELQQPISTEVSWLAGGSGRDIVRRMGAKRKHRCVRCTVNGAAESSPSRARTQPRRPHRPPRPHIISFPHTTSTPTSLTSPTRRDYSRSAKKWGIPHSSPSTSNASTPPQLNRPQYKVKYQILYLSNRSLHDSHLTKSALFDFQ